MNLFNTKMTALDADKVTTCEQKRVSWRKGLTGVFRHSEETRAKISSARKGKTQSISAEARAKMSAANKGKTRGPRSAEHRAKLSAANKGKTKSAETRAKMSAANKGKKLSAEHRAKISATKQARNALKKETK